PPDVRGEGEAAEEAMADWLIGEALAQTQRVADAIGNLIAAESQLHLLGMIHQWINVRLSRVAAMMSAGFPPDMIRPLCVEVAEASVALDTCEPSRLHNCTAQAIQFLRENAERDSLTAGDANYVAGYVRKAS